MKLNKLPVELKAIQAATFPEYRGRLWQVEPAERAPKRLDSYWDGGSRTYYAFYSPSTGRVASVHSNHPFFEPNQPRDLQVVPEGVVLVAHRIFCGKNRGLVFYIPADILTKMLPEVTG